MNSDIFVEGMVMQRENPVLIRGIAPFAPATREHNHVTHVVARRAGIAPFWCNPKA